MPKLSNHIIDEIMQDLDIKDEVQAFNNKELLSSQEIDDILHAVDTQTQEYKTLTEINMLQKSEIAALKNTIKNLKKDYDKALKYISTLQNNNS